MRKGKHKIINTSINILIIIIFFISIGSIFNILNTKIKEKQIEKNTNEMINLLKETDIKKDETKKEDLIEDKKEDVKDLSDLDYYRKYYNNNDIVGSLKIDGTNIYTLLVKTTNNKYYLGHSLYRKYDGHGTVFVDYRTDLQAKQINIYGHNSNHYYYIFKDLEKYMNKDFYNNHKYINLWDGKNNSTYEIFSIQIVTDKYEHIKVFPKDPQDHIDKLKNSIYDTGVPVNKDDKLLILQTCSYNPVGSFLIINSKKI